MENENMMPVPEQPMPEPPEAPQVQPPAPPIAEPPEAPQYQPPMQPTPQPPEAPQIQPPAPSMSEPPEAPQYQPPMQPTPQPPEMPQLPKKKSKLWKILLPILAGVLVLAALACVYFFFLRMPSVERIELSERSLYLKPGDVYALEYTYAPADAAEFDRDWRSSDEKVAAVKDGTVTAVGDGKCEITLYAVDGPEAMCCVEVVAPPPDGDIVGTWRFDGAFIEDEYYADAEIRLTVFADRRAALVIDGKETGLSWRYKFSEEGVQFYDVVADDGTRSEFWYYAEAGGDYAGKLVLYGNEENMFIFRK